MKSVLLFILLAVGVVFCTDPAFEEKLLEARSKGEILLNFQNTDIDKLALFMGKLTGKNVVVDPAVRGNCLRRQS